MTNTLRQGTVTRCIDTAKTKMRTLALIASSAVLTSGCIANPVGKDLDFDAQVDGGHFFNVPRQDARLQVPDMGTKPDARINAQDAKQEMTDGEVDASEKDAQVPFVKPDARTLQDAKIADAEQDAENAPDAEVDARNPDAELQDATPSPQDARFSTGELPDIAMKDAELDQETPDSASPDAMPMDAQVDQEVDAAELVCEPVPPIVCNETDLQIPEGSEGGQYAIYDTYDGNEYELFVSQFFGFGVVETPNGSSDGYVYEYEFNPPLRFCSMGGDACDSVDRIENHHILLPSPFGPMILYDLDNTGMKLYKTPGSGRINAGESLFYANGKQVRLDRIENRDGEPRAIVSLLDEHQQLVGMHPLGIGSIRTIAGGCFGDIRLYVSSIAPDYEVGAQWAYVAIITKTLEMTTNRILTNEATWPDGWTVSTLSDGVSLTRLRLQYETAVAPFTPGQIFDCQ